MSKFFKAGDKVQWSWLGRPIDGVVCEIFTETITKEIKGKSIKRKGSKDNPAYLVQSKAGNFALKLFSELLAVPKNKAAIKAKPQMFKS